MPVSKIYERNNQHKVQLNENFRAVYTSIIVCLKFSKNLKLDSRLPTISFSSRYAVNDSKKLRLKRSNFYGKSSISLEKDWDYDS